jgi:hypothetical protein
VGGQRNGQRDAPDRPRWFAGLVACGGSESVTDAEEFAELNAGHGASELVFPHGSAGSVWMVSGRRRPGWALSDSQPAD